VGELLRFAAAHTDLGNAMERDTARTIAGTTIAFFALLALVTAVAWSFQETSARTLDTIYVVIALAPFVFYLFAADKLKQFKGGGIELTLRDEAAKEVEAVTDDAPIEFTPASANEKSSIGALDRMLRTEPPTTLAFVVGRENYYAQYAIQEYIDALSDTPQFRHVLFKSPDEKFLGYMHAVDFKRLLDTTDDIVQRIENETILQHPAVIRGSTARSATNRQALHRMDALNLSELAVLDEHERFAGTITQDEIVRKILANVIRES
jgi:hypothetical protein